MTDVVDGTIVETPAAEGASPSAPAETVASSSLLGSATAEAPAEAPAPIEYTDFTLPEGFTADDELMGTFRDTAKSLGIPQSEAQKFVDLASTMTAKANAAAVEAYPGWAAEQASARNAEWAAQTKADAELGSPQALALARSAVDKINPKLLGVLEESGLGNHPEMIRALVAVGKLYQDAPIVKGMTGGVRKTAAEIIYSS